MTRSVNQHRVFRQASEQSHDFARKRGPYEDSRCVTQEPPKVMAWFDGYDSKTKHPVTATAKGSEELALSWMAPAHERIVDYHTEIMGEATLCDRVEL
jgi:hypothetical protein